MTLPPGQQALFDRLVDQIEPDAFIVPNMLDESGSADPAIWSIAINLKRIGDCLAQIEMNTRPQLPTYQTSGRQ